MKLNDNDNKLLMLVVALFTLAMIAMYSYRQQIEIIKDNQRDIDRRITNLEQSINQSDTAIVNLYQHLNEIAYKNK